MAPTLLVGSCEPFSGKSAVVLGLARQLLRQGIQVRFGKPLATSLDSPAEMPVGTPLLDADVRFVGATLGLPDSQLIPSLQVADPQQAQQRRFATARWPTDGHRAPLRHSQADLSENVD